MFLSLILCFSFPSLTNARASFEKTMEGDEVPNYVRADITGIDDDGSGNAELSGFNIDGGDY